MPASSKTVRRTEAGPSTSFTIARRRLEGENRARGRKSGNCGNCQRQVKTKLHPFFRTPNPRATIYIQPVALTHDAHRPKAGQRNYSGAPHSTGFPHRRRAIIGALTARVMARRPESSQTFGRMMNALPMPAPARLFSTRTRHSQMLTRPNRRTDWRTSQQISHLSKHHWARTPPISEARRVSKTRDPTRQNSRPKSPQFPLRLWLFLPSIRQAYHCSSPEEEKRRKPCPSA